MPIIMMSDSGTDPTEQYDAIISMLDESGHGHPKGRLLHLAAEKADGGYLVVDVWESQEELDGFAQVLLPLIQQAGGELQAEEGITAEPREEEPSAVPVGAGAPEP